MISMVALAVVGSWSYSGFLAEPTPAPTPVPAPAPEVPPAPVVPEVETGEEAGSKFRPKSPTPPPSASPAPAPGPAPASTPAAIASKPTMHRSTDASGQTWEHPDSAYLSSFVEARNRSLVIYTYTPSQPSRASRCFNGRCN